MGSVERWGLPLAVALGVGLAACVGEKPVEPTDDDDDDTDTEEVDTAQTTPEDDSADTAGEGSPYLEVTQLYIDAELGWDASTRQLVEIDGGDFTVVSTLYLVFGTDAWREAQWDPALDDEYCVVILPLTSADPAPWAVGDGSVWFGVDYVEGLGGVQTDCGTAGKELDPELFGAGEDPVITLVEGFGPWGVGIGEWGPSWSETWIEYFPEDVTMFDQYVGARVQTGFDLDTDDFRALPVEIDPVTYAPQVDGDLYVTIPPALVPVDGTIATGWYRFHSMYVYGL